MGQCSSKIPCVDRWNSRNGNGRPASAETKRKVSEFLESDKSITDILELESLLSLIPMEENIFGIYYENGFNLLQKCAAEDNVDALKLLLARNPNLNNFPCSHPLHIACVKGYEDCVELLLRHGARPEIKSRMCWPGPHQIHCKGIKNECRKFRAQTPDSQRVTNPEGRPRSQNALFYAVDRDLSTVLFYLMAKQDSDRQNRDPNSRGNRFFPKTERERNYRPLLELACEKRAWSCCNFLLESRSEEITLCDLRRHMDPLDTSTMRMTLFHVLFLMVKKPAEHVMRVCELLVENGLGPDINAADAWGNTPLHGLIVRYAFEEMRTQRFLNYTPWQQQDMKLLVEFFLQNGARDSINQPGNSALSCVLRHINDWGFCYELLDLMLRDGGNPNIRDRDGNFPLTICLTPLLNVNRFRFFTETSKVRFMNCLRILCLYGANPNCMNITSMTPLHILVFTASENLSLTREEMKHENFDFIKSLMVMLFEFGLDPNIGIIAGESPNVFHGVLDMLKNSGSPPDVQKVYELVLTLVQYGVDPNRRTHIPNLIWGSYGEDNPFIVGSPTHVLVYLCLILAKKEILLSDPKRTFARVLYLFYYCMNHKELFRSLKLLFIQQSQVPSDSPCQNLCEIIRDLCKPRTLKQMARVAVHEMIMRRPGLYVENLDIPLGLKNYLKRFEP